MNKKVINVGIVDDHAIFRRTLKSYLLDQGGIIVPIESAGLSDFYEKIERTNLDLVLLDIFLPESDGSRAVPYLRQHYPHLKILVLSMSNDMKLISSLLEEGIHGYVCKSEEPEELVTAIRMISENRIYRSRLFTEALYHSQEKSFRPKASSRILNEREKKILRLIWEEKSNKEIADELLLGVRSVEKIRQDLKEKLGVKSTVGLLKHAISWRIIGAEAVNVLHTNDMKEMSEK